MGGNLETLWKMRAGAKTFKDRDSLYRTLEDYVLSRSSTRAPTNISPKPLLLDAEDAADERVLVNWASQVVNHRVASFSRIPRTWNLPWSGEPEAVRLAQKNTNFIYSVFAKSSMKALQPLQAWRFSVRGEAVQGVEWDKQKKQIYVRCYDPAWCYPSLNDLDLGAMNDLLITYEVDAGWARKNFKVDVPGDKKLARVFIYWTTEERTVQVDRTPVEEFRLKHDLGFVPFRWAFARPNGQYAQSDVRDVIRLQDVFNEALVLSLDALRKTVYKAYWGVGIKENVVPQPDEVIAFTNTDAHIYEFPSSAPPEVALGIMDSLGKYIQSAAGVSPISLEGTASGSIVTGAAVRHQVEAVEARSETQRVVFEMLYSKTAEYILRVLESQFPDAKVLFRGRDQQSFDTVTGSDVKGWYDCTSEYGSTYNMPPEQRSKYALEGLGRLWDDHYAVKAGLPDDIDPDEMVQRLQDYQVRQAEIQAKAQGAAQEEASQGQVPSQGPPGVSPPQMAQPPQPPIPGKMPGMVKLTQIENALKLVEDSLKGQVWAIGELAIAGMSAAPVVMVSEEKDRGKVETVVQPFHGQVVVGQPEDTPHITLA